MSDDTLFPPRLYTRTQEDVLAIIPYFTAFPSAIASGLIVWCIWFDRKQLLKTVYHRLVLGISCLDFLTSLSMVVLGPWAVPSDYQYGRSGRGNIATCETSGFFLGLIFGNMWYMTFLCVHFVFLIRWEWKERRIACCLEPFAHFFGLISPVAIGIFAIFGTSINPMYNLPGWCLYSDLPPFCARRDNEECIRGANYSEFSTIPTAASLIFLWIVVIICMVAIILKVRRLEWNLGRYAIGEVSYARTRDTSRQAMLYIATFLVVFSPVVILNRLTDDPNDPTKHEEAALAFALLTKFFTPLQGVLNALVYFRNRLNGLIKPGKSLSLLPKLPWIGPRIVRSTQSVSATRQVGTTTSVPQPHPETHEDGNENTTSPPTEQPNDPEAANTQEDPETPYTPVDPETLNSSGGPETFDPSQATASRHD